VGVADVLAGGPIRRGSANAPALSLAFVEQHFAAGSGTPSPLDLAALERLIQQPS